MDFQKNTLFHIISLFFLSFFNIISQFLDIWVLFLFSLNSFSFLFSIQILFFNFFVEQFAKLYQGEGHKIYSEIIDFILYNYFFRKLVDELLLLLILLEGKFLLKNIFEIFKFYQLLSKNYIFILLMLTELIIIFIN